MLGTKDKPLDDIADDKLNRALFVERLANALLDRSSGQATGLTVGITGPWGSGKSSILNFVQRQLEAFPGAVVIRFNPWLVSHSDLLIEQFFRELRLALLRADGDDGSNLKLAKHIEDYASSVAPNVKFSHSFLGTLWASGWWVVKKLTGAGATLNETKEAINQRLNEISFPIIVLVDELDRVEDAEIRSIAQLVRAIMDFDRISFLLAYDHERVVKALSRNDSSGHQVDGEEYLEKIVHLAIPLPVSIAAEIRNIFEFELDRLIIIEAVPKHYRNDVRYNELISILIPSFLSNVRIVKRVVRAFEVLSLMMKGEVDPFDRLAYCALMVKAPKVVELIRRQEFTYIFDDMASIVAASDKVNFRREDGRHSSVYENSLGDHSLSHIEDSILYFMFPILAGVIGDYGSRSVMRHEVFMSLLRLGLPVTE